MRGKVSGGKIVIDLLNPAQSVLKVFNDAFRYEIAGEDDAVIGYAVITLQSLFAAVDHAIVVHEGEMLGNVCLACADFVDNLLNRAFPFAENPQNFQPHGFRQQFEAVGDGFKHLVRHIQIPLLNFVFGNRNRFTHNNPVGSDRFYLYPPLQYDGLNVSRSYIAINSYNSNQKKPDLQAWVAIDYN